MTRIELTKDRRVGLILVAEYGEIETGETYSVRPDLGCHIATDALYKFKVERISEAFEVVHDICVVDEEYSYDGLRPVGKNTVMTVYGFGKITGREGDCRW